MAHLRELGIDPRGTPRGPHEAEAVSIGVDDVDGELRRMEAFSWAVTLIPPVLIT